LDKYTPSDQRLERKIQIRLATLLNFG
jgi:hypothetical protein